MSVPHGSTQNNVRHIGTCALCLEDGQVLQRSHILPEPFYKSALLATKPYPIYSSTSPVPLSTNNQKGLYERLLCRACEGRLSRWETYALGQMWNRSLEAGIEHSDHFEFKVEYAPLKLFHLSLLWRMGVAQHPVFSNVQLGLKHEERLRTMLLTSDTGAAHEYPCLLAAIASSADKLSSILILPRRRRTSTGHSSYDLLARGFLWQFIVSGHSCQIPRDELPLTEAGIMRVYKKGYVPAERYMSAVRSITSHFKGERSTSGTVHEE